MDTGSGRTTTGWASSALILTSAIAIAAKITGVLVTPGARGVVGQSAVTLVERVSGTLAYALTGLLVALVCTASYELARSRTIHSVARGGVVAVSGLVVALASPAVVERLRTVPTVALAVVTSAIGLFAGLLSLRSAQTRALGAVLALLAFAGLLRIVAWESAVLSYDRASMPLYQLARGLATVATSLHVVAVLVAAAWIGTRSRWRGRLLANLAIVGAFATTWLAGRAADSPSTWEAILQSSLPRAAGQPAPYLLGAVAAFLVPASILLAAVALLQPVQRPAIVAALALALLSHGAFDVPLQALLAAASAAWAMVAMSEARSLALGGAPIAPLPPGAPDSRKGA